MSGWQLDWDATVSNLAHLLVAYVLSAPIALNRELEEHSAGLRTFPLVAVGACAFVLVGLRAFDGDEAQARIVYGIITGIGFIGGGAILRHGEDVSGTATAASIWNTGAIGVAVGWGAVDIAIVLAVISVVTLVAGRVIKERMGTENKRH